MALKIDTKEFDRTIAAYKETTRRDIATIVNTKAFYIARAAARGTKKADKAKILEDLRGSRSKSFATKKGGSKIIKYTLAQLIIVARRAAAGLSTKKADIKDDVKKLIASRVRAINFLRAGWIPAIRKLEPLSAPIGRKPPQLDSGVKKFPGRSYGSAKAARPSGTDAVCQITNDALAKDKKSSFLKKIIHIFHNADRSRVYGIAAEGLQKAIDSETASMKSHIEEKLRKSAHSVGIKTN